MSHSAIADRPRPKHSYRLGWCLALSILLLLSTGSGPSPTTPDQTEESQTSGNAGTQVEPASAIQPRTVLIGLGDSLTHGTMDATNNAINTLNAYLQKVASSLARVAPLRFTQPLFDVEQDRLMPFLVPTNLGVDGADVFSAAGLQYYKRSGADHSFLDDGLLANELLPGRLQDKYDKVLYPINLLARRPISQIGSAAWLLREGAPRASIDRALVILWLGNNDSGLAALGAGGQNPQFQPIPFEQIGPELKPMLRLLLGLGQATGQLSFKPYEQANIERNLTDLEDFSDQYNRLLSRLRLASIALPVDTELFLLTLPYYSAVGYLFDSEDLEYYLRKLDPDYTVPPTFKRVAPPGVPITDPLQGDRVSLLTFGLMYALLSSGHPVDQVNQALEVGGHQRDGLVLSEEERQLIISRIDGFNAVIREAADAGGPKVHLVEIGQYLNDGLAGNLLIEVDGHVLSRKWVRGSAFSLDGVHPGYTGQALVANFVLERINEALGIQASPYDLAGILATDPYVDQDGDGWAAGPPYEPTGLTRLLALFNDPDDGDPGVGAELPSDVWDIISDILLDDILKVPAIQEKARHLGITPTS